MNTNTNFPTKIHIMKLVITIIGHDHIILSETQEETFFKPFQKWQYRVCKAPHNVHNECYLLKDFFDQCQICYVNGFGISFSFVGNKFSYYFVTVTMYTKTLQITFIS